MPIKDCNPTYEIGFDVDAKKTYIAWSEMPIYQYLISYKAILTTYLYPLKNK